MDINLKNIHFTTIYEWPLYGRMVVIVLACLGFFYFGYFFDFSNLSGQIYIRYQQEQDLKQQIKSLLNLQAVAKEDVSQLAQFEKLLSQWQGQLINGANLPDLLNQILKWSTFNQLQFSLFNPGTEQKKDDYNEIPIKIVMQGNYNQVANFISQIANMSEIVSIGDFIITSQNPNAGAKNVSEQVTPSNRLTTELMLEVYYLAKTK